MAAKPLSKLYVACRNGDANTVELLLKTTSLDDINRLEPNGSTCLHAASYNGHAEIVRMLLARGASRTMQNSYGCTALDEAKTQEIAELFPRTTEAAKKRYTNNPARQPEWQFAEDSAESYSRAIHWGCMKDRGVEKTIEKIRDAGVLNNSEGEGADLVRFYFNAARITNNPVLLLKAYTVESDFYLRLNSDMATGSQREVYKKLIKKWTGYYTGLIAQNRAFEPYRYCGLTYRGMGITPNDFSQYKIGVALTNKSFQSTSKSWKIAKGFACPSEPKPGRLPVVIIFTITDRRSALSIDTISEYRAEEEVLIIPGTLFIVTDINTNEIPYEIEMKQLEWKDEF